MHRKPIAFKSTNFRLKIQLNKIIRYEIKLK